MNRWWRSVALVALVGCGGPVDSFVEDDTGPEDSGLDDTGDVGNEGTCEGNPFTLHFDALVVASPETGFDLDAHETLAETDPVGCGKVDVAGGIDNALASLDAALSGFDLAIGPAIADSVQNGQIVLDLTVAGYDGGPEDDCVAVDITVNGETATTAAPGVVTGGALVLAVETVPLQGTIDLGYGPQVVDITMRQAQFWLPMAGDPVTVSGGLMGAGIPWEEPTSTNDLRALVQANVLPAFFGLVEVVMLGKLDLQPPGAGATAECDALSAALVVHATEQ